MKEVYVSSEMKKVFELVNIVSNTDSTLLITGEPGVGKASLAFDIHRNSKRSKNPFVEIDPASSIPETLVEAEIFGYIKGAFTGAIRNKKGSLANSDGGTLFIKNVENLPLTLQVKLLRAIQNKSFNPVGSTASINFNSRIITTSSSDLKNKVRNGQFREDLFYRLSVIPIRIPPLRERSEDIIPLANEILDHLTEKYSKPSRIHLTKEAEAAILEYSWPGNIVELRSSLENAAIRVEDHIIDAEMLSLSSRQELIPIPELSELRSELVRVRTELEAVKNSSIIASPIWQGKNFSKEKDLCFVLMPLGNQMDLKDVYENHIKVIVDKAGLNCLRADDIYGISGIMQSIWENINRAKLIIADLTDRNPNVFYELGIVHTLGVPVILVTQSLDFVPFDLRHLRCLVYDFKPKKISEFEDKLFKTIKTVIESGR